MMDRRGRAYAVAREEYRRKAEQDARSRQDAWMSRLERSSVETLKAARADEVGLADELTERVMTLNVIRQRMLGRISQIDAILARKASEESHD